MLSLNVAGSSGPPASSEVVFTPDNPTTEDVVSVIAQFRTGPFVETQSHSIDEDEIHVLFVQDGLDFSPNPPHEAIETIGRLPAGRYTIFATVLFPGVHETTTTLDLVVTGLQTPQEIPVINTLGAITLMILLLLIGLFAIRARTYTGFVSLILVFSFLPEADLLAEETNSLYVLLALGENAPTPSEVVEG